MTSEQRKEQRDMKRNRSSWAGFFFSLFVLLALYVSALIGARHYTTVFLALMALAWHLLANVFCAEIASYRFKNPAAKYVEVKNDVIRTILVRPFYIGRASPMEKSDRRANLPGLVLHIVNTALFTLFEILLFLPEIPSAPYIFELILGTRPRNYTHLELELDSWNEIIAAEGSRAFACLTTLILFVFIALFEHRLHALRREEKKASTAKKLKRTEWYFPLYSSLIELSVRRNKKKHKFWYEITQLGEIETLARAASGHAEVRVTQDGDKPVSFTVVDTLNDRGMFTGYFL